MIRSVLLVDDEKNIREFISYLLTHYKFEVVEADSGNRALKLLRKRKFSIVLSDIKMPNGDGVALLEGMKKDGDETPIIMMTGYADDYLEKIKKYKTHSILHKPIKAEQIIESINSAIDENKD